MKMNKRGEVVTLTVVAICLLSAVVGAFFIQLPMVKGVLGVKDQKTVNTSTTTPVWLVGPKGEKYLATQETVMADTLQVKQSVVNTLIGWIAVLGVLCFIFPALGIWLRQRAINSYKALQGETKKIVKSVQAARTIIKTNPDATLITKVDAVLDGIQDQSTKDLVTKLKQ
jgi:uncharacterized membrane protein YedE/YeeE